jgi:hypothetical protein
MSGASLKDLTTMDATGSPRCSFRPTSRIALVLALALSCMVVMCAIAWVAFGQPKAAAGVGRDMLERPDSASAPIGPVTTGAVILYGDSLAWEAQAPFRTALLTAGFTRVITRTYGGTAICDWLPQMRIDESELRPIAVVIEFSGDEFTPCMQGPTGAPLTGAAYYEKYLTDAQTALSIFTAGGTVVYLAGAPISRQAWVSHDPVADRLNQMYAGLADSEDREHYVDAGSAVLDRGRWTKTLPCLVDEPCTGGPSPDGNGVNVVRGPDGNHFCPEAPPAIQGVTVGCPVYSSGAYRYGTAMAGAVIVGLRSIQTSLEPVSTVLATHAVVSDGNLKKKEECHGRCHRGPVSRSRSVARDLRRTEHRQLER